MGLPAESKQRYTLTEYLQQEQTSEEKHEYGFGQIIAMAGGTYDHSIIAANVIRSLGNRLEGKPCRPSGSDLRIRIPRKAACFYPDVSVVCGKPQFDPEDPSGCSVTNPRLVVEVMSPSSEARDRGEKFHLYRELESLEEYVLVSQDTPRVETFFRQSDGTWLLTYADGLEATIRLRSLEVVMNLREIYADVPVPMPAEDPSI